MSWTTQEVVKAEKLFTQGLKKCNKCYKIKGLNSFYKCSSNRHGLHNTCRLCSSKTAGKYLKKLENNKLLLHRNLKKCPSCGKTKVLSEFSKSSHTNTGVASKCRLCVSITAGKRKALVDENTLLFTKGLKKCTKCLLIKELQCFNKDSSKKYGLYCSCKECSSVYKIANTERTKKTIRKYRQKRCISKHYVDKINDNNPVYTAIYTEGHVLVRCYNCNTLYNPTNLEIQNFLKSGSLGYRNIYCSTKCKDYCDILWQQKYRKGFKKYKESRWGHEIWSKLVKERDNYTCQKCGTKEKVMYAHHIIPYAVCKFSYLDPPNGTTLCKTCHNKVHQKDGCTIKDLRDYKEI